MDVKTTFLMFIKKINGDLEEEISMKQLEGCVKPD